MGSSIPTNTFEFSDSDRARLEPHMPPKDEARLPRGLPFTLLTFATSLDSSLSLSPGTPTAISGLQSKAMTHYLRSRHEGILIGVGTAVADDPTLNCRIAGVGGYGGHGLDGQPRPIIVDLAARWDFSESSMLFKLAAAGRGRAPWIITAMKSPPREKQDLLKKFGGKFITMEAIHSKTGERRFDWQKLLGVLRSEGLKSVMIEGGAVVINTLLEPKYLPIIDMTIVTIGPTWLGQGGVVVSPARRFDSGGKAIAAVRLKDAKWYPFGEDIVLCGKIRV